MKFSEAIEGCYYRVEDLNSGYLAIIRIDTKLNNGFKGPRVCLYSITGVNSNCYMRSDDSAKCTNESMKFELYPATIEEIVHLNACIKADRYVEPADKSLNLINDNYLIF